MSFDVHLEHPAGPDFDIGNYTSNVAPMWRKALPPDGIAGLDGKKCWRVARVIRAAVKHMEDNPDEYKAMNPPNGWGDYDGALEYLRRLADAATTSPRSKIRVSR